MGRGTAVNQAYGPRRDFSNGFLFAEVLSRYYPGDIEMHSFENVTSVERKRANWVVLEKLFKVRQLRRGQGARGGRAAAVKGRRTLRAASACRQLKNQTQATPLAPPLPQRRDIPIESRQVEAVISAEGDAASDMLQLLYAFINSDAFT